MKAVLVGMDQRPQPLGRTGTNTTGCPGQVSVDERSGGVKNVPPSRWKALGDSGSRAASPSTLAATVVG